LQVKGDEFCPVVVVVVAAAESNKGRLIAVVWIDATPHDDRQTDKQGWMHGMRGERERF
jgi:hypothetical protein